MPLVRNAPQKDVTYRIIGAAMEIHNKLGPAHTEEIYQKALELKLPEAGLSFEPQRPVEVFLDETALGFYYLDFLVEERVIVEIKAKPGKMSGEDQWQVIKYFSAIDCPVALYINFGRQRLEYHRLFPPPKSRSTTGSPIRRATHDSHPLSVPYPLSVGNWSPLPSMA